jgi:hypothetical protein
MLGSGRLADADSSLELLARRFDGTCVAAESSYMRALIRLSQAHDVPTPTVVPLIDQYLGSTCVPPERAVEATLLRGIASLVAAGALTDSSVAGENRALKQQLEQTRRELERLRLRIIPPGTGR